MLYTGTGDKGTTNAFGCDQQKISKSSELPEALGALDELNAFLGFVKLRAKDASDDARIALALREMQENLFIIQAELAGTEKHLASEAIRKMETMIGDIEREIPPITGFSIAGGTEVSALIDVARTLARRAERRIIAAKDAKACKILEETLSYMNRLSSLLFALARLANHLADTKEEMPRY